MAKQIETDVELIQASVKGNNAAFEGLVAKYQSLVCAITYGATGDIGISEELAQEAFVRAWKDLAQLRELTKFRAWVCSIARTTISNYYRREKRNLISHATPLDAARAISSNVADPGQNLIAKEQQAVVAQALLQLPESYREPLILFYRQNQSTRQVAEQLELSEDNVRTRLHRGRKMLKEQVVAMVEKTLASTAPGKTFTATVMASAGMMAKKGSGVAAAATATTTTGTSIAAVMSGVTAKIITTAAVVAIAVGAVSAYKHLSSPDQPLTRADQIAAVEEERETLVPPESTETQQPGIIEAAQSPIETPKIQAATTPNTLVVADEAKTEPASISQTTQVPGDSEYIFEPKGVLCGLITDKDTGEPVVDAEIIIYGISIPNGKLVTDINGFYSLETIDISRPYKIRVGSREYVGKPDIDDDYKISIEKDKHQIAHFQLEKACITDLWVKDEQGNPIQGASIKVVDRATNRSTAASRSNSIVPTDQDGYTLIGGHPASKAGYMVIITHEGRTGRLITSSEGNTHHETKHDFASAHIVLKNTDPDIVPAVDITMKKGKAVKGHLEYSDGVPASDLNIVSEPYWWSETNLSGQRTQVAPDGSFTLSHITPEKYSISAYYPVEGSSRTIKIIDFSEYDGALHFTLSEPSPQSLLTIKGTVKVIKKAPVSNLYIRINSYNTTTNTHGSSASLFGYDDNDEAEFEINRLQEGNYRLTFQSEHFTKVVLEDIKPPVDDLYIEMEQRVKPEIVAEVIDKATGKPVTSMRARLIKTASRLGNNYSVSEKWLERSSPQGNAVFTVTPGVYQVQIMADGYGLGISEEIDTEDLKPVTVELTKGGTIKGRVLNSAGNPVAGAEILALSYAGGNGANDRSKFATKTKAVVSDTHGNFVLEDLPEGLETIKADHKDYSPAMVSDIAVINGTVSEDIIVELKEGALIEGYVFDNSGNALAGIRMDYDRNRERVIMRRNSHFVVTDPNGYYRIEGLGEHAYFVARNRGSFTDGVSSRTMTPVCGEVTRLDFGGNGYLVAGAVVMGDMPSAQTKLALQSNQSNLFHCYTTTDADGTFVFTGVIEGKYNIRPVDDFRTMLAPVDVVNRNIHLGVIGNNLVEFEVVIEPHEDWKALQQVMIVLPPTAVLGQQRDETDKQNRLWRFVNIVPGKYNLRLTNDKAISLIVKVDIAEAQAEPWEIKPPKLDATLTGNYYRSASRKSMPRYLLLSNQNKTVSAYLVPRKDGVPDANGQFEAKLPAGQYQISYRDGTNTTLLKAFEIISGQHLALEIDLDATLE